MQWHDSYWRYCLITLAVFKAIGPLVLLINAEQLHPCYQPLDRGPCRGHVKRWYYDPDQRVCKSFDYGGCAGNANNYQTRDACEQQCGSLYGLLGNAINATFQQNASANIVNPQLSDAKPGVCPNVPAESYKCANECRLDSDCPKRQKCCFNGCGRSCMNPDSQAGNIVLTCPPIGHVTICIHICNGSSDCPPGTACCPESCGNVCVDQSKLSTTSSTTSGRIELDFPRESVTQELRTTHAASWFTRAPVTNIEIQIQTSMPSPSPQFQHDPYAAPINSPTTSMPSCPRIPTGSVGNCQTKCLTNADCQKGQICCWNGCGRECVDTNQQSQQLIEGYKTTTETRRSTVRARAIVGCPEAPSGMAGTCDNECKNDSDCPTFHVCCNRGCGHVCVKYVQNVQIGAGNRIDSANFISATSDDDDDDVDEEITRRTTKRTTTARTTTATTTKPDTNILLEPVTPKLLPTEIITGFADATSTSVVPTTVDQRPLVGGGGGTGVRGTLEPSVVAQMFTELSAEITTLPATTSSTSATSTSTTSSTTTVTLPATTATAPNTITSTTTTSSPTTPATSTSSVTIPSITATTQTETSTVPQRTTQVLATRILPDQPLPGSRPLNPKPYNPYIPDNVLFPSFPHQAATAPPDADVPPFWATQRPTRLPVVSDRYDAYAGFPSYPSAPYNPFPKPPDSPKPNIRLPDFELQGFQYGVESAPPPPPPTMFAPVFRPSGSYRPGYIANLPNVPISYLFGGSNNFALAFNGLVNLPAVPKPPGKPSPSIAGIPPPPLYPNQPAFFGRCPPSYLLRQSRNITIDICFDVCEINGDCPPNHVCCSNGCGRQCIPSEHAINATNATEILRPSSQDDPAKIVRPGLCPSAIPIGPCIKNCTSDSDCRQKEKCCSTGCGQICRPMVNTSASNLINPGFDSNPGSCPAIPLRYFGDRQNDRCSDSCSSDIECRPTEKCCFNGCGLSCLRAIVGSGRTLKPGHCPGRNPEGVFLCTESCRTDNECAGDQKCCGTGCGNICMDPAFATNRPGFSPGITSDQLYPEYIYGINVNRTTKELATAEEGVPGSCVPNPCGKCKYCVEMRMGRERATTRTRTTRYRCETIPGCQIDQRLPKEKKEIADLRPTLDNEFRQKRKFTPFPGMLNSEVCYHKCKSNDDCVFGDYCTLTGCCKQG